MAVAILFLAKNKSCHTPKHVRFVYLLADFYIPLFRLDINTTYVEGGGGQCVYENIFTFKLIDFIHSQIMFQISIINLMYI